MDKVFIELEQETSRTQALMDKLCRIINEMSQTGGAVRSSVIDELAKLKADTDEIVNDTLNPADMAREAPMVEELVRDIRASNDFLEEFVSRPPTHIYNAVAFGMTKQ